MASGDEPERGDAADGRADGRAGDGVDDGGDDACWLDRVCDRCGGFIEQSGGHHCRAPA